MEYDKSYGSLAHILYW